MKKAYISKRFHSKSLYIIDKANQIIEEYQEKGFDLTLRQLYYQFVARDIIPNKQSEYDKLGNIINDGRLAGLIDWNSIVDRTRGMRQNSHWTSPAEIMKSALYSYAINKRRSQPIYIEVWIEKDALSSVISGVCEKNDVPYLSCRGYTSQSEMWRAGQRIGVYANESCQIIHLGDHDPSGIDMTRDIEDRLNLFIGDTVEVHVDRVALNMDQIELFKPPPNPAKVTDSRYDEYCVRYGNDSWELDALDPEVIVELTQQAIDEYTDFEAYDYEKKIEDVHKKELENIIKSLEDKND